MNVVAGLDGSSGRQSHYDPLTDLRYFWIQGEDIGVERNYRRNMSAWETFGINHSFHANYIPPTSSFNSATALPASALPMADYAAVDSSTNADYRLRPKFIQESYSLTSSDEGRHCSGIPWLVRKCWWDQVSVERESGTMMYFQDVKADKRVNVKFIGSDTGSLNVTSAGGIKINGNVRSVGGNTRLIATGGDIALTNAQATIELGNLEILASGSIGTADTPLRLQQVAGATIDATAGTGMNIRSEAGSLLFTNLDNTNGDVTLYAGQNIEVETGTNAINGDDITMTALYGSITESGGGSMRLDTSGTGIFNAKSRTGGLDFSEISGNLQLGTVDAIGNVALTTLSGSILDNNEVQSDDVETQAELLDLWEDLQLRGTDAATKRTNQIATYERESTELYQDYWRLRDVQQDTDGNYIAQDYNPNFSYTASAAERTAMNNDAGRIASYEASQQARYQKGHEQFGGASYDPTYAHVASSDESDIFTAGYYWADHELEVPLPGAAFKETTDTTAYVESANIIGDNISLTVAGGNIGAYSTIANYDIADVIDGNLTSAQKLQLSAAESDDLSFDNMDAITAAPTLDADGNEIEKPALSGILTLTEREDLDIEARNQASVVTINAPSGYAFIGGENSTYGLNIDTLAAAGEVRLKVNGDVKNARADNAAVLSSQSAVIESGDGAIGAAATPFRVDVANGAKITARALGGVYIEETAGDMNIGQIYSPNRIELTSAGRLLDAGADLIMDVKGDVVQLTANGSIGEQFNVGDSVLTRKQKALDVGSVNYGTSQFEITSNTDGAWLYGPLGQSLRMTGADLAGELDLAVGANIKAQGIFDTDGNDITFRSYEGLQLDGDGTVNTMGATLNLDAVQDLTIASAISTANGSMVARADNIIMNSDATIDLGAGSLRMNATEDATITGITTSNDDGCAAGQTGCAVTLLATNIIDGGNENADITMNGNGGLRVGVHQYANINQINHSGSEPLSMDLGGKNNGARGVASMLGVNAPNGVNVANLSMNSAVISAPQTAVTSGGSAFTVTSGNIRDNLYLDIGAGGGSPFLARVGRLEDSTLSPDSWLLAGTEAGYFNDGAVEPTTTRSDDYRCTGAPAYIGNATAVLDFSFSFNRPFVDCSGVLNFYSPIYSLATVKQTVDQEILGQTAGLMMRVSQNTGGNLRQSLNGTARQNFALSPASFASEAQLIDLRGVSAPPVDNLTPRGARRTIAEAVADGILDGPQQGTVDVENIGVNNLGLTTAPQASLSNSDALSLDTEVELKAGDEIGIGETALLIN